ncbi:MAG TPA: AMMECR1 domain-containing protein, partial [bacterium]|nr:AMMECR1 domain-containing protein [bacterium]
GPVRAQEEEGLRRFRQIRGDPVLSGQLSQIVAVAMQRAWGGSVPWPEKTDPVFEQPLGVFVTLKRNEEIRGCMGSLKARKSSFREEIAANLKAALSQDPRHRRVEKSELEGMEIYLTTAGTPQAVERFDALSPRHDAILLKSGAKEAVVLPGEARTLRYLLAFAKAKAGVKKGETYVVYRLPVVVLSPD